MVKRRWPLQTFFTIKQIEKTHLSRLPVGGGMVTFSWQIEKDFKFSFDRITLCKKDMAKVFPSGTKGHISVASP